MECELACVISRIVHCKILFNCKLLSWCKVEWIPVIVPIFSIGFTHLTNFSINPTGFVRPNRKPYRVCMSLLEGNTSVSHLDTPLVLSFVNYCQAESFVPRLSWNINNSEITFSSTVFASMPRKAKTFVECSFIQKVVFIIRQLWRLVFQSKNS